MSELSSAVFLDRDGVINRKATEFGEYYVTSWGNFEFLPKATEGIRNLNELNFHIFVTTNQRGVAREI